MKRNFSLLLIGVIVSLFIAFILRLDPFLVLSLKWSTFFNKFSINEQFIFAIIVGYSVQIWLVRIGVSHINRLFLPKLAYLPLHVVVTSLFVVFLILNFRNSAFFFEEESLPFWGIILGLFIYIVVKYLSQPPLNQIATKELLFNRDLYVDRILSRLKEPNSSAQIALCGEYGAGKTTILDNLQIELEKENWLIVRIDSWGVSSSSIGQYILQSIITKLSASFDVSSFQSLPLDYQLAMKSSNNWLYAVFRTLTGQPTSLTEQLKNLDDILDLTETDILIRIEDIDRNSNPDNYCNSLAVILDKLNSLSRLNFIIATGYTKQTSEILRKVCGYREDLVSENYLSELDKQLKFWVNMAAKDGCVLGSDYSLESLSLYNFSSRWQGRSDRLSESINNLIATPRILMHIKVSVDEVWRKEILLGEVDLIDLLIITLIREAYPEIFELVLKHEVELSNGIFQLIKSEEKLKIEKERISSLFRSSKVTSSEFKDISNCLAYVFPAWDSIINENDRVTESSARQKISSRVTKVNYFKRIARKKVGEFEESDQKFLIAFSQFNNQAENSIPVDGEFVGKIINDERWMELFNRFASSFWSLNSREITEKKAVKQFFISIINCYKTKFEHGYTYENDDYNQTKVLFLNNLVRFSENRYMPEFKRKGLLVIIVRRLLIYDLNYTLEVLRKLDSTIKYDLSKYFRRSLIRAFQTRNIFLKQEFNTTTLIYLIQEMSYKNNDINADLNVKMVDWIPLIESLITHIKDDSRVKPRILNNLSILFTFSSTSGEVLINQERFDCLNNSLKVDLIEQTKLTSVQEMKDECDDHSLFRYIEFWHDFSNTNSAVLL
ncbi:MULTISPECIES: P-loop NTPase fold protein [unclassified Colwellia]|uniref:P-loop NTPase fold protein n=1 Tax=unclassified Colwellia TaxID=196834 RepID=UPI0015F6BE7D|nr:MULTISPECIES: P-loop NTPase fold protein [unclassified Colwellia]MBA6256418.1 hypothetical protein [Colwellia sp. MB3u-28]MBA6260380.1 hypothetical protein [Colwellia sp. MB3u-41]